MIENKKYYDQDILWGQAPDSYQVQVLADILDLLPENVNSILDVGCGDGYITNALPKTARVVGLDISEEALQHIKVEKRIGSITQIPFPDKSFELVMANDVLEHLSDEEFKKSLEELQRVAKKYILITIPHNEQLEVGKAKCQNCNNVYHIHYHHRSFKEQDFITLIGYPWKLYEVRYSGSFTSAPHDPTVFLKQRFGLYRNWAGAICPFCGSNKEVLPPENNESLVKLSNSLRHSLWYEREATIKNHINRSEIIALFTVEEVDPAAKENHYISERSGDLLEIDFTNKLQIAEQDFTPGATWAKFRLSHNSEINDYGVNSLNTGAGPAEVLVRLPVVAKRGDKIKVWASGKSGSDRFELFATDGVTGINDLLFSAFVKGEQTVEIDVEYGWNGDVFGLPLTFYLYGDASLKTVNYISLRSDFSSTFLEFEAPGHYVISSTIGDIRRSWGIKIENRGLLPKPQWLFHSHEHYDKIYVPQDSELLIKNLFQTYEKAIFFLKSKLEKFNDLLNDKENQREKAEAAYLASQKEIESLNEIIVANSKEIMDLKADVISLSKCAEIWRKSINRRVQKVLVLSHMYPSDSYPSSGPFIHEQVLALREHEGIDARVVSCQPYWINFRNILKNFRARILYKQNIKELAWTYRDGVPVFYPSYQVGLYLPFWAHAWTYRAAVMGIIEKVRREFKFDLVHAHTAYLDGTAGLAISKKYNVPLVITEHTGPFTYLTSKYIVRYLTLKSILSAKRVWCVSNSLAEDVKGHLLSEQTRHIRVLFNGVNTNLFTINKDSFNKESQFITILFVGIFVPVKNIPILLNAFKIVRDKISNARLLLVGGGEAGSKEQETAILKIADRLGIRDSIEIRGFQPREEIARIMLEECDMLVLPSQSETFGVVLIEAMACGKPVIATRCGGPESIIVEPFLGELCDKDSSDSLADAIVKVVLNLKKYDPEKIRQHILQTFDYRLLASNLASQYQGINDL